MSRFDEFLEDRPSTMAAFLVLGPVLLGQPWLTGLINPVWGSLYGFPAHLAGHSPHRGDGSHPWFEAPAALLWPLVLFAATVWLAHRVVGLPKAWRNLIILLWSVSALVLVPMDHVPTLFQDWPVWTPAP